MVNQYDLFYDIWEVLTPHAFCDLEATEWTDEVMSVVLDHLSKAEVPVDKDNE